MATEYEVTAACVTHIPASTSAGPMLLTLYRGNRLPSGVPEKRLQHLLSGNMIRAVEEPAPEPVEENDPAAPPMVNSRSSKADLVNYGDATSDYARDELDAMTVKELQALFVKGDQP